MQIDCANLIHGESQLQCKYPASTTLGPLYRLLIGCLVTKLASDWSISQNKQPTSSRWVRVKHPGQFRECPGVTQKWTKCCKFKKKLKILKRKVLFFIIGFYCLPSGFASWMKARIVIFLSRWIIADVYADLFHLNYPNIF